MITLLLSVVLSAPPTLSKSDFTVVKKFDLISRIESDSLKATQNKQISPPFVGPPLPANYWRFKNPNTDCYEYFYDEDEAAAQKHIEKRIAASKGVAAKPFFTGTTQTITAPYVEPRNSKFQGGQPMGNTTIRVITPNVASPGNTNC